MIAKKHLGMLLAAVLLSAAGYVASRSLSAAEREWVTERATHVAMDSIVEVTVVHDGSEPASPLFQAIFAEVDRIERLASFYEPESDLSRLNARPTAGGDTDPELVGLLRRSVAMSELTGGTFDITVAPLYRLWGFVEKKYRIPEASDIDRVRASVGYQKVKIIDSTRVRFTNRGTAVILGGIAKGYAVDRAVEILRRAGVYGALVNIAGDLRVFGHKTDGSLWRVGVRHPRQSSGLLGVLTLSDRAVATSGDYERYFEVDGVRYHHLFDPATGRPARDCRSVTIITDTTERADALATAVFVMGPEHGIQFIDQTRDVEGLIVSSESEVFASQGLGHFGFQPVLPPN